MDLLTLLFRLPLLPLQGFVRLAQLIQQEAEAELADPSRVRRELEEAEQARVSGEMSDRDVAQVEGEAVGRLIHARSGGVPAADSDEG